MHFNFGSDAIASDIAVKFSFVVISQYLVIKTETLVYKQNAKTQYVVYHVNYRGCGTVG